MSDSDFSQSGVSSTISLIVDSLISSEEHIDPFLVLLSGTGKASVFSIDSQSVDQDVFGEIIVSCANDASSSLQPAITSVMFPAILMDDGTMQITDCFNPSKEIGGKIVGFYVGIMDDGDQIWSTVFRVTGVSGMGMMCAEEPKARPSPSMIKNMADALSNEDFPVSGEPGMLNARKSIETDSLGIGELFQWRDITDITPTCQ